MAAEADLGGLEPDILGVVRSHWRLIGLLAVTFALFGFLYGSSRPSEYRSTAELVVDDPQSATLFGVDNSTRPERYLETQIGIITSPSVAEAASQALAAQSPPVDLSAGDILSGSTVASPADSDLITVSFVSESPETAAIAADAIVTAYLEVRRSEAIAGFAAALNQLDESIAQANISLADVSEEIDALQESNPLLGDLQARYEDVLSRLVSLQDPSTTEDGTSDPDELLALASEVAVIEDQLNAIEAVSRIESQSPELAALLEEQSLAIGRLSSLIARRNEVAVDAELAGGGFVFQSGATAAQRVDPGARVFGLAAGIVGAMIGVAVAYALAIWRRRIDSVGEPETILRSPLLGAIPEFDGEIDTWLPVENAVHSRPAEAFRFVVAAVESQLSRSDLVSSRITDSGDRMVFVTAGSNEDGTTTTVANIAIAAARPGRRVLLVDGDFTTQRLSELLLPEQMGAPGLGEVVVGTASLSDVVRPVPMGSGGDLFLLSRGSDVLGAQDLFASRESSEVFSRLRETYDLILVDAPPLHHVGYATTLARLADRVLVVVRHRSLFSSLEDLRRRLLLINARDMGYVYNRIPLAGESRRTPRSERVAPPPADDLEVADTVGADDFALER